MQHLGQSGGNAPGPEIQKKWGGGCSFPEIKKIASKFKKKF
jgi:hypothetical protein